MIMQSRLLHDSRERNWNAKKQSGVGVKKIVLRKSSRIFAHVRSNGRRKRSVVGKSKKSLIGSFKRKKNSKEDFERKLKGGRRSLQKRREAEIARQLEQMRREEEDQQRVMEDMRRQEQERKQRQEELRRQMESIAAGGDDGRVSTPLETKVVAESKSVTSNLENTTGSTVIDELDKSKKGVEDANDDDDDDDDDDKDSHNDKGDADDDNDNKDDDNETTTTTMLMTMTRMIPNRRKSKTFRTEQMPKANKRRSLEAKMMSMHEV